MYQHHEQGNLEEGKEKLEKFLQKLNNKRLKNNYFKSNLKNNLSNIISLSEQKKLQKKIKTRFTLDETLIFLLKRKFPNMILNDENLLNFDSSQPGLQKINLFLKRNFNKNLKDFEQIKNIKIKKLNTKRIITLFNEKNNIIQHQYDFHCFYCKKHKFKNLDYLVEHIKYFHKHDFVISKILNVKNYELQIFIQKFTKIDNLKLFEPLSFKVLPENSKTFIASHIYQNSNLENVLNEREKEEMTNWVKNIGEYVNAGQIQMITEINLSNTKDMMKFILQCKQTSSLFWMDFITFLRSLYVHQQLFTIEELENMEMYILQNKIKN
ncbi:hypothetical protein ABK040_011946 [Willaertia magna]